MKWDINDEDQADFEQEKKIQEWLAQQGGIEQFDFKHITRKGTPRNTLIKASISLDQQISEDGPGTFADLIGGFDGRDLFNGDDFGKDELSLDDWLAFFNFKQEDLEWLRKTLLLGMMMENKWLIEEELPFEILPKITEWEKL